MLYHRAFKVLLFAFGVFACAAAGFASSQEKLLYTVYNAGPDAPFPVTSVILYGPTEAALIDAQFQKVDAEKLVKMIKETGRKLTTIYISFGDPQSYFGLEVLTKAFPDARVIAAPKTVQTIQETMDERLSYFTPLLQKNAPKALVLPQTMAGNFFTVDGEKVEVKKGQTPYTYLWVPSIRTVLGGNILYDRMHIWLVDRPSVKARLDWTSTLGDVQSLKPLVIIPGHFLGTFESGITALSFTRDYLINFNDELKRSKNSEELIAAMEKLYPGMQKEITLQLSAKVLKGELKWPIVTAFSGAGKTVLIDLGTTGFSMTFNDEETFSFSGTKGGYKERHEKNIPYQVTELRPNLYMISYTEKSTGSRVVQVQDYDKGLAHVVIAGRNGSFLTLSGTLKVLEK